MPELSVIIPTYNGRNKIGTLMSALEKQTFKEFEAVVVIDGSTDDTKTFLESQNWEINELKIIEQENMGRAEVRNRGVRESIGDILIFFDDDMNPKEDCIERHFDFQKNTNGILVGGCLLGRSPTQHDLLNAYRRDRENKWLEGRKSGLFRITLNDYLFTTGNMSVTRELFDGVGGFDGRLKDSEDFDFSMRAIKKKTPMYYDYNTFAFHEDHINLRRFIDRQTQYHVSKLKLGAIKPEYKEMHPPSFRTPEIGSLRFAMLSLFRFNKRWENLLNSRIYGRFSTKLQYRLIDLIVFSSSVWKLKESYP